MFKLPQNPDTTADGLSDDQPLRLEGIKRDDFRQLLRVMYPRYERTVLLFLPSKKFTHQCQCRGSHIGTMDIGIGAFRSMGHG